MLVDVMPAFKPWMLLLFISKSGAFIVEVGASRSEPRELCMSMEVVAVKLPAISTGPLAKMILSA